MGLESIQERIKRLGHIRILAKSSDEKRESSDVECPKCKDENWVAVIKETGEEVPIGDSKLFKIQHVPNGQPKMVMAEHELRACTCQNQKKIDRLFTSDYLTEACRNASFHDYRIDGKPKCILEARSISLDYLKKFETIRDTRSNSIMLLGAPGSGKTHLLRAISRGLMMNGIQVKPITWVSLSNELKHKLPSLPELTDVLKNIPVLFIDDLYIGRDQPTGFMVEQFFDIVDHRYSKNLPMLISSERSIDELYEIHYGIADRLYQMSEGHRAMMALTQEEEDAGLVLSHRIQQ